MSSASDGQQLSDELTDEQRRSMAELISSQREPSKRKGPVRLSEEDLPLRRSMSNSTDIDKSAARPCLFTTADESEESDDEGISPSRRSGLYTRKDPSAPRGMRSPGGRSLEEKQQQVRMRGSALPLPMNRTRFYEEPADVGASPTVARAGA